MVTFRTFLIFQRFAADKPYVGYCVPTVEPAVGYSVPEVGNIEGLIVGLIEIGGIEGDFLGL